MRKYVGHWYIHYKYYTYAYISFFLFSAIAVFLGLNGIGELFGIDVDYIYPAILAILIINCLVVYLLKKRYEYRTYFEINEKYIEVHKTSLYTFFTTTKKAPLENILDYEIKQNPVAKAYKIYVLNINCGSEFLKFYVEEVDIRSVEDRLNEILENNLEYRRYKDEQY